MAAFSRSVHPAALRADDTHILRWFGEGSPRWVESLRSKRGVSSPSSSDSDKWLLMPLLTYTFDCDFFAKRTPCAGL